MVSQERQYILAVALLVGEQQLALLDGRPLDDLEPDSHDVLESVPAATKWARSFTLTSASRYAGLRAPDGTESGVVCGRGDLAGLRAEPG